MTLSGTCWAFEQIRLRRIFEKWVRSEIERYEAQGFERLFGGVGGHEIEEAGGYTRSFVGAYSLTGDPRIPAFLKRFRDDWVRHMTDSGHFYHGYSSNESGDTITHTAEAFTQFLLNVLYMDPFDEKTIALVEDGAEHLGNWNADVQPWYDWDEHAFRSYYLGTRSPYHRPPFNFQTPRHFRVLIIALAAWETTGKQRYLDLCQDYAGLWMSHILAAATDADAPLRVNRISAEEFGRYRADPEVAADWRFANYYGEQDKPLQPEDTCSPAEKPIGCASPPLHAPHDMVSTWLDIYRHAPRPEYARALRRLVSGWIAAGPDTPSQVAGLEPHVGLHLAKYRAITGDTSLDESYLELAPEGPSAYLVTGEAQRLNGFAAKAEGVFEQGLLRNAGYFGKNLVCRFACSTASDAGCSSAYVMPALFLPVFGGIHVHYGRPPCVCVLYYREDGSPGLPESVATLYVPAREPSAPGQVRLANTGNSDCEVAVRSVSPRTRERISLTAPAPDDAIRVSVCANAQITVDLPDA